MMLLLVLVPVPELVCGLFTRHGYFASSFPTSCTVLYCLESDLDLMDLILFF